MLDLALVRILSIPAFLFFLSYVVTGAIQRRKSWKLKKSAAIEVHGLAKASWTITLLVIAIASLLPPFFPAALYWHLLGNSSANVVVLQLLGYGLMLSGGALGYWALRSLGRFMTPEIMVTKGHRLVTKGPYRWIRHPAYTAVIILFVGLSLFYLNPVFGLLTITTVTTAVYRARKEEKLLASRKAFGTKYIKYTKITGMFLPKPR